MHHTNTLIMTHPCHSRTFGNASPGGGVGVRMLVPLIDMINHGGDQTASGMLADPDRSPTDNVRQEGALGTQTACVIIERRGSSWYLHRSQGYGYKASVKAEACRQ